MAALHAFGRDAACSAWPSYEARHRGSPGPSRNRRTDEAPVVNRIVPNASQHIGHSLVHWRRRRRERTSRSRRRSHGLAPSRGSGNRCGQPRELEDVDRARRCFTASKPDATDPRSRASARQGGRDDAVSGELGYERLLLWRGGATRAPRGNRAAERLGDRQPIPGPARGLR